MFTCTVSGGTARAGRKGGISHWWNPTISRRCSAKFIRYIEEPVKNARGIDELRPKTRALSEKATHSRRKIAAKQKEQKAAGTEKKKTKIRHRQ